MPNLKRLICKKFGGTSNFVSFILVSLILYLLVRNHLLSSYDADSTDSQNKQSDPDSQKNKINEVKSIRLSRNKPQQQVKHPTPGPIDPECQIDEKCTGEQVPYKIISGDGMDKYPMICFNGKLIVSKNMKDNKIGRGINLLVIDQGTFEIKTQDSYDTFTDDAHFFRYIKTSTSDGDIVVMASYDEMANGLRDTTIQFMENFGSQLFKNIKFRDSFVMIGQKGVAKGKAIEIVEAKGNKDFATAAKLTGCATFPLGIINPIKIAEVQVNSKDQIAVGGILKNCGLREECKSDEFPVHIYTGKNDQDEPKICVDGRYIISKGVNDAGRGLNIVVVGNGKEILKTAHFDTYAEDSTNLEIFLESLYDNVILIVITFDEASQKLATLARNLFFDLGSGLVQNLRHRDAWYLVGRKGIKGFSPIEEISYAGPENAYPAPLDRRFCVPQTLKGLKIRPDPLPNMNDKRRDFCSRYDGYGDFCISENIDKPLKPAPIINKTLEEHPVYSLPIVIVGGISHNSLRMTLETVIMQPGIRPENVYVCLDEKLVEHASLVDLFEFQYVRIQSSFNYVEILHKALEKAFSPEIIKDKNAVIIIEEDLILSPDFLYFFTQVYNAFTNDLRVGAVSAWNPNSFLQLDGSSSFVYKTDEFPGLGFMLKKNIYEFFLKDKLSTCCAERAWNNWVLGTKEEKPDVDVIIPDVSRIFHRPYDLSKSDFSYLKSLFNRKRKTNLIPFPELIDLDSLESFNKYKAFLIDKLKTAIPFPNYQTCFSNQTVNLPKTINQYYKITYEQSDPTDLSKLKTLTKCFHLFNHESHEPKGLYLQNILRFNAHQNNYILIGSKNPLLEKL